MKFTSRSAAKIVTALALLFLTQNILHSQVFTRILGPGENIYDYLPWYFNEKPGQKIVPYIDVQAVLTQDSIEGRQFQRLGIRQSLDWDINQGTFYQFGNYHVWKLAARSQGAMTLGFKFTNLVLPQGSEMFIYNLEAGDFPPGVLYLKVRYRDDFAFQKIIIL